MYFPAGRVYRASLSATSNRKSAFQASILFCESLRCWKLTWKKSSPAHANRRLLKRSSAASLPVSVPQDDRQANVIFWVAKAHQNLDLQQVLPPGKIQGPG